MDLFLIAFLAVVSLFSGLIFGLSVVGYGRLQIGAAITYFVAFIVLLLCVGSTASVLSSSSSTPSEVDRLLRHSDRLFDLSRYAINIALSALIVFVLSGTVRIWTRRHLLFAWGATTHLNLQTPAPDRRSPRGGPPRYLIRYGIPILFACWGVFIFWFDHRAVRYYLQSPYMLLYAVGTAIIMGLTMACLIWYSRRTASHRPPGLSSEVK
ncbi:MAG: hypothetical protein V4719_04935 [Planctomycetota bacterium]